MSETARLRLRGAPIIHDTIDNETIAINQMTGAYYSLEGPSALVWQLLADGADRTRIRTALGAAYDADPAALDAELDAFLEQLVTDELVVPDSAAPDGASNGRAQPEAGPAPEGLRRPFNGLRLQRYTDLEVLLLADPIHEVDDTGWPKPVTNAEQ